MIKKWLRYENDGLITEVSEFYNPELTEISLDIIDSEWKTIYVYIIIGKLIYVNGELVENPNWTPPDLMLG